MVETKQTGSRQPWGKAIALLAACAVTLIGVARDLPPETICLRALGAAVLLGGMAGLVGTFAQRFMGSR